MYLISLLTATLLSCVIGCPYFSISLLATLPKVNHESMKKYQHLCTVAIFFNYLMATTKILSLTLLSLDRFIAIVWPYFYERNVTRRSVICFLSFAWIQALITTLPMALMTGWVKYYGNKGSCCGFDWEKSGYGFIIPVVAINFFIPAMIVIFTNIKVFCVAKTQMRSIRQTNRLSEDNSRMRGRLLLVSTLAKAITLMDNGESTLCQKRTSAGNCIEGEDEERSEVTNMYERESLSVSTNVNKLMDNITKDDDNKLQYKCKEDQSSLSISGEIHEPKCSKTSRNTNRGAALDEAAGGIREIRNGKVEKITINITDEDSVIIDSCDIIINFGHDNKAICENNTNVSLSNKSLEIDCIEAQSISIDGSDNTFNEPKDKDIHKRQNMKKKFSRSDYAMSKDHDEKSIRELSVIESIENVDAKEKQCEKSNMDYQKFPNANGTKNGSFELCEIASIHSIDNDSFSRLPNSKRLKILSDPSSHREQMKQGMIKTVHRSLVISTILLVFFFLITWLPFVVSRMVSAAQNIELSEELNIIISAAINLDIVMNPVVILGTRKSLRQALLRRCRCTCMPTSVHHIHT